VSKPGSTRVSVKALTGRLVILWPDNDDAGREHMARVAATLRALGCRVETIDIDRLELSEHGDVVDYLAAHPNVMPGDLMGLARLPERKTVRETGAASFVGFVGTRPEAVSSAADGWPAPKPIPTELSPVRAFDFELLPESLRPWIRDAVERFQCPPDYLAVAAIVSAGSLVGRRVAVRPQRRTDWTEYGNLWGLVIGRPGSMKSPAIKEATRFLRQFEQQARESHNASLRDYESEVERFEVRRKESQRRRRASVDTGGILTSADAPASPIGRRYIVNDATVEALHLVCGENPQGILTLRDEVSGLLRNLDREEFASDRAFYLEAWAGNSVQTLDRIGRGGNLSARLNLSMLGGAQPARIQGYVAAAVRGMGNDDGLLQRFGLFVWPDDQAEWRNVDRYPDSEARRIAAGTFQLLSDLSSQGIGAETDSFDAADAVPFLRLNDQAQGAFDEWLLSLMTELRTVGLHPALESHLSKYKKLVPSLALVLHLVDGGTGPIARAAMIRALAWSEYLRSHAERLYGSARAIESRAARSILSKLRACAVEYVDSAQRRFDARSIYRQGWTGLDRETTYAGLELLADLDYLRSEPVPTGGRTATLWRVNPEALR
jgi:uncharacterized protein DUF3987